MCDVNAGAVRFVGFGDFTTSALLMTDVFEALISSSPKAVKSWTILDPALNRCQVCFGAVLDGPFSLRMSIADLFAESMCVNPETLNP